MSIGIQLVTKNVQERNNPAVYDQGRVRVYASAEKPVIEVQIPAHFYLWDDELADYQRVLAYLNRRAAYVRSDICFGNGSVSYFLDSSIYSWMIGLLADARPYRRAFFDPGLFMAMIDGRGIPKNVTGNEAIQLVHWLRETFTVVSASSREPKFAVVDVKSMGTSSSIIEITVDKAYVGLLIGKGGATIKAIREGIAAMYGHTLAIVRVKGV
ncbi:MAG TPA: KH domain-containing protein [Candidatus Saccharimonadales bacterium]|nr:KH domain-containing protein [Candidatus Saccharimonadales bacterium]